MSALPSDSIPDLSGVVDTVTSTLDAIDVAAVSDAVVDAATDLADVAGTASVVAVRTGRHAGSVVRRHPKHTLGVLAAVVAVIALVVWVRRDDESSTSADLQVAA